MTPFSGRGSRYDRARRKGACQNGQTLVSVWIATQDKRGPVVGVRERVNRRRTGKSRSKVCTAAHASQRGAAQVGDLVQGKVTKLASFGAFVGLQHDIDGLVHISQLAKGRVAKTTDVIKEGDKVKVKLLGFDDRGKIRLSMRAVDQATGEDLEGKEIKEDA